eukprot:5435138-Pleurochrysis_carterae.AAC.1
MTRAPFSVRCAANAAVSCTAPPSLRESVELSVVSAHDSASIAEAPEQKDAVRAQILRESSAGALKKASTSAASRSARRRSCAPALVSRLAAPIGYFVREKRFLATASAPPAPTWMSIRMRSNGKPRLAIRSRSASVGSALYVEGKMYLNGGAPNCLARSSIAATCSTKKGLYCSFPSSKALTLYGAACPSAARRRPHVVVVASPHAYSTRSAQSSASLA